MDFTIEDPTNDSASCCRKACLHHKGESLVLSGLQDRWTLKQPNIVIFYLSPVRDSKLANRKWLSCEVGFVDIDISA